MRVFSIEGKFQQNWQYSELTADFKRFFVLEDSGQIQVTFSKVQCTENLGQARKQTC